MRKADAIPAKIFDLSTLAKMVAAWRVKGDTISFTNGVFDLLHEGHIFSLSQAAAEGKRLIVAVNSDASVKRLKGPTRPLNNEQARALVLASLVMVDAVVIFEEDTPLQVITTLLPDVLVKGGDYTVEQIAGAKEVLANGGRVVINPLIDGISTTGLIQRMQQPA
ncbi:D-glycero-beta-D-manno-heptose 1-phosphate adenylyltransferase [Phnomibacter ginsenosidimutans]|uniref:D-glycero-beta-D-manno-heptose 1-phosphate adenylyltransferase n=1 Tax=Phnomibacter ginsenosidimutans TaxID=2676868 RepID=A0A6I6GY57_9BACT|nr:D-glycero-beta-D-manno-heptose 1-phosphate adenylyltransferase [Phnomibacter ginsenosidimutans]QGW27471.1 D-glycero-beta-D-manno-heptose 1-phosphate adenylyltransferase [Phnomibacter ginsenosidimutans]